MPEVIPNSCKLFADDAKIFGDVSKLEVNLQSDIDKLHDWSVAW